MRALERYAWTIFLAFGLILVLFGVSDFMQGGSLYRGDEPATLAAVTGMTWDELRGASPAGVAMIDLSVHQDAINEAAIGLFALAIALTAVRRGERWAWFLMWLWPLFIAAHMIPLRTAATHPTATPPVPLVSGAIFLVISAVALGLTYRRSFRKAG